MSFPSGIKKSKLKSLPPSTIEILKTFEKTRVLTTSKLISHTGYSIRTIRYSLKALLEEGIIQKQINLTNVRTIEYKLILMDSPALQETKITRAMTEKLKSSVSQQSHLK